MVLAEPDPILALGAIVARELYGRDVPIVVAAENDLRTGDVVTIRAEPSVAEILSPPGSS